MRKEDNEIKIKLLQITKIKLLEELIPNFSRRIVEKTKTGGKTSGHNNFANWKKGKTFINQSSSELIVSVINEWLKSKYDFNTRFTIDDFNAKTALEFLDKLNKSDDPRFKNGMDNLIDQYKRYYGYYKGWMYWYDTHSGNLSVFQFLIKIGTDTIDDTSCNFDESKSINTKNNSINCYMSTKRHWLGFKTTTESTKYKVYEYRWWQGEMLPFVDTNHSLWFCFWNPDGGTAGKYANINAIATQRRPVTSGIEGLYMAQPSSEPTGTPPPTCTKIFLEFIPNENLNTGSLVELLNDMGYKDETEVDENIIKKICNTLWNDKLLMAGKNKLYG